MESSKEKLIRLESPLVKEFEDYQLSDDLEYHEGLPNGDIKYLISCGIGCTPVVDLSEFLKESEDFIEYSLPLKCFSNNSSLDLSKVNLPMYLATKGPLDLDLMNVEIGRDKGDKVLKCY